jgi:hypothetical protein
MGTWYDVIEYIVDHPHSKVSKALVKMLKSYQTTPKNLTDFLTKGPTVKTNKEYKGENLGNSTTQ